MKPEPQDHRSGDENGTLGNDPVVLAGVELSIRRSVGQQIEVVASGPTIESFLRSGVPPEGKSGSGFRTRATAEAADQDTDAAGKSFFADLEGTFKALALAVGAFAVIMYSVLVLAYAQFYGPFGISMDEVGRSKFIVLPEVLAGPFKAIFVSAWFFWTLAISVLTALGLTVLLQARRHGRKKPTLVTTKYAGRALAICLILALTGGALQIGRIQTSTASRYGAQARDRGFAVSGIYLEGRIMKTPLLEIVALPVTVAWTSQDPKPPILQAHPDCLLYLGQNDDTVVLYDIKVRSVLRLQASDIALTIRPDTLRENPKQQNLHWPCRPPD